MAIVLFEMLTGKPYFEAEASSKLEWMIRNYRTLQASIALLAPGLREILSRALDPDLNRRFTSAATLQAALYEWRRYAQAGPAVLGGSRRHAAHGISAIRTSDTRRSNVPIRPPVAACREGAPRDARGREEGGVRRAGRADDVDGVRHRVRVADVE